MLNARELTTVLAALQFWQEEMCPHGMAAMHGYLPRGHADPLTAEEIDQLRGRLVGCAARVKHVLVHADRQSLADTTIYANAAQAESAAVSWPHPTFVAQLILPDVPAD